MSVRQTILRYMYILSKVRKAPSSFSDIDQYLKQQSILNGEKFDVSKRQFQRDIKDISSVFELEIVYDARMGVYLINEDELSDISNRRIEAFDVFNAFRIGQNIPQHIQFEKRKPIGTEHLFDLLQAIKKRQVCSFTYQKYWETDGTQRQVEPLGLKEYKNRWYLISKDINDEKIKSFAIDRLSNLKVEKQTFQYPENYRIEDDYRYCFGIIRPTKGDPEEVILSFDPIQGKYIKSLPLHDSQTIVVENADELRIKMNVHVTYDLLMEILSYGQYVKVIQPKSLAIELKSALAKGLMLYQD